MSDGYWTMKTINRRVALRGAALGGGLAALSLVGCSSGGSGSSGKASPAATNDNGPRTAIAATGLDYTKGKPGGKITIQTVSYPSTFILARTVNQPAAAVAGFTHSGLLELKAGRPGIDGTDPGVDPDLAQALPEQPNDQTYVFKLMPAKFHNGRTVTSEDVKYSYERYAFDPQSGFRSAWIWLDKVEAPDPQTVVVRTKFPFADGLASMAAHHDAFVLAKEWEEGPDVASKLMGSGAWLFVDTTAPVVTHYKKNPDYFRKPFPYFDEVEFLGDSDFATKVAQLTAHQAQYSYWFGEEDRVKIKQSRPDMTELRYGAPPHTVFMRVDQAPFSDQRVRQALSMAIDRKAIVDGTTRGLGVPDQVLSSSSKFWGFRKPSELIGAKNYTYDVQTAKQLLSAAGVTLPIETQMSHWDSTPIGQAFVDTATLVQQSWRQNGIANSKDNQQTLNQATTTYMVGNYDGTYLATGGIVTMPAFGLALRNAFTGSTTPPTTNTLHVNDTALSDLMEKQLRQLKLEDRKATLHQVEDTLSDKMYRLPLISYFYNFYLDPSLRDAQVPIFATNAGIGFTKWWWFA